ncbi:MAG TPA: putative maltokinase, partial [Oculatellaceae cyanobacterium]
IGMGDNVYVGDRNGVRTPMHWTSDRNAGFSRANPHRLYLPVVVESEYHYEALNVEAQRANPNSLWYAMKRLIATRKRFQALGRGTFELLHPENRKVLAFTRTYDGEHILVVANLSRFVQTVELDLSLFKGMVPVEIFGRTEFPPIGESSYFLSISPYSFYWFTLQPQPSSLQSPKRQAELPSLVVNGNWQSIVAQSEAKASLESILPHYLYTCPWFDGKARTVQSAQIVEVISVPVGESGVGKTSAQSSTAQMIWVRVDYTQGEPETYLLLLAYAEDEQARHVLAEMSQSVIAHLQVQGNDETGILFEAMADKRFLTFPLDAIAHNHRYQGKAGELVATATDVFPELLAEASHLEPTLVKGEHSNTSVVYGVNVGGLDSGHHFILKLFRKLEEGINPDLEIRKFLAEKKLLEHFASLAGALEYRRIGSYGSAVLPMTVGILQEYILDTQSSWDYTLDSLRKYFEHVMVQQADITEVPVPSGSLLELQALDIPDLAFQTMEGYLPNVRLLGQRTAELHIALASDSNNPNFAPEPFSSFYQRSIYQYARNLTGQVLLLLQQRLIQLPPDTQKLAHVVLNHKEQIIGRFQLVLDQKITAVRTRYHGDYGLEEVLYTGKDFIIIDFEGEPGHSLSERRMKRSPLRDVAGMLQSFNHAATQALRNEVESGMLRPESLPVMEQWTQFWYCWVSAAFLNSYLEVASQDSFLPKTTSELQVLLDAYLLEKVIYELGYELNHRPDWVEVPLRRILQLQNFASGQ